MTVQAQVMHVKQLYLTSHRNLDYCAYHVLVQPNFRRYHFHFLPDQAQTHIDHFNVLDELWCKISFKSANG